MAYDAYFSYTPYANVSDMWRDTETNSYIGEPIDVLSISLTTSHVLGFVLVLTFVLFLTLS